LGSVLSGCMATDSADYRAAACNVTGGVASLNFDAYRAANFLR